MGFLTEAATMQSTELARAILYEQQETNRLLRKLAGEPQPEHEASDTSRAARRGREARRRTA